MLRLLHVFTMKNSRPLYFVYVHLQRTSALGGTAVQRAHSWQWTTLQRAQRARLNGDSASADRTASRRVAWASAFSRRTPAVANRNRGVRLRRRAGTTSAAQSRSGCSACSLSPAQRRNPPYSQVGTYTTRCLAHHTCTVSEAKDAKSLFRCVCLLLRVQGGEALLQSVVIDTC